MDIRDRRILVLGGWGLVGTAILRKLVPHQPKEIIILSLREDEARAACSIFKKTAPNTTFTPEWGNVFVRDNLKDLSRSELLENEENRHQLMEDTLEAFDESRLQSSFLNQVISRHKPHIIIDSINTATALAYQDLYKGYYQVKQGLHRAEESPESAHELHTEVEKLLTTLYTPQIIRHVQVLHASMVENNTAIYLKIGTTGTGGMGLNIPYTHSEERPSRVLLSKTSMAGAHTLLLFLMGRTPDGPICKEIKPAAAIAWKGIQFGEIQRHGQPIKLIDCPPEEAIELGITFDFNQSGKWQELGKNLESVYIDTGENGIFSLGEFETITSAGQMEFVTPEEIAENVILEILGDSTGHDILNALDNSIMGPTYRAGYMRHQALEEMERLQKEHQTESVAFEILGPPRLSKLLYEAHILTRICGDLQCIMTRNTGQLSDQAYKYIQENQELRSGILSIGIPILLSDGKHLLRGPEVKIPTQLSRQKLEITKDHICDWAHAGWIDLREENMRLWQERMQSIQDELNDIPTDDTSSQFHHGPRYWRAEQPVNIGKVVAWIFINEDKGLRVKR